MENTVNSNTVAITLDNFQQVLVEESKTKLILVDFWAEQVPESVQLKSALEQSVQSADEYILLATVDCNVHQQIAMQFGVKSLPTVVLFKHGQPVDGFAGVQSESEIKALLQSHLPKPQDEWHSILRLTKFAKDLSS